MAEGPEEPAEDRRPATLVRAAAATYGTNFAAAILGLANVFIVARSLGPTGRGDVAFVMTVALLVSQLAAFSVQESNANLGGSLPTRRPSLVTNSFVTAVLFGTLGALIVAAIVTVFPVVGGEVSRPLLWLGLATLPVLLLKFYLQFLLQSDYRFALPNMSWVAGPMTTASVNGTMSVLGIVTVGSAISVWIAGQLLALSLLIYGVARHFGFGRIDVPLLKRSWSFGAKTHVGQFLGMFCYRSDQWFIGASAGSRELGIYSVARAWAELLFYLPAVIVSLQRPDLVRAKSGNVAEIVSTVYRRAAFLGLGAAIVLVAAAPILCVSVFGSEFGGAVKDLRVLALAAPGIVTIELLTNAFVAQRRPLIGAVAFGVAFVFTVGLNLLLVPSHGGLGAAIATGAAYTAGGALLAWLFIRTFHARPRDMVPRLSDVKWYVRKAHSLLPDPRASK